MSEIQKTLQGLKQAGTPWTKIADDLGVTSMYVAMLARGERKIRQTNPLYAKILRLSRTDRSVA